MKGEKQPAVFELIHAMDRTERGYFVKFANMLGKGKNHIALFGILADMDIFDKNILLKKLKRKKIHTSNLNVTLRNLYLFILKSLRLFHEKNYYKIHINSLLAEIEIVLGKGLKSQAIKLLDKAEKLAQEHHYYTALIEIQKIKVVQKVTMVEKKLMESTHLAYQKIQKDNHTLSEELSYRKMQHCSLLCLRINKQDAAFQYSDIINDIKNNELINDSYSPNSFYAKYYKENIKANLNIINGNRQKANEYYKKIIKTWDEYPKMIQAEPLLYRNNISNYLHNAIFIKKADDFHEQIKKLENISARFLSDKIELFQSKIFLEQLYYLNYRKIDEAYQSIDINKTLLEEYKPKMNFSRLTIIQYNYLIICFLKEKHHEGLYWINEILYTKNADPKKNVRLITRILELILHYELRNVDLVESLLTSVWRKRKSDNSFYLYTESILNYLKNIIKAKNKQQIKNISKEFLDELLAFEKQSPKPIGIEELIFWVKSKVDNVSIEEVYMNYE